MVAAGCQKDDLWVAVFESQVYGGTCPLRGCNPNKVLMGAAEVITRSADMQGKGITQGRRFDWPDLIRFERIFTEPVSMSPKRAFNQ